MEATRRLRDSRRPWVGDSPEPPSVAVHLRSRSLPHTRVAGASACLVALLATLGLALALAPASASAASAPPGFRPFAPDSIWNLPLRDDASLSPDSARQVGWLQREVAARGGWINTVSCAMPLYWADPSTPRVRVELDHPSYMDPALIRAWSSVPIPPEAKPANCSDKNFSVAQVQPDGAIKQWEFWSATKRPDGTWVARWGGAHDDLRTDRGIASPGMWQDPTAPTYTGRRAANGWNVTASSVSMNAGVITLEELAAGRIDHALAFATADAAKGHWSWPAQRSDGTSLDPDALPQGARLRIDPSVDLSTLSMPPLIRSMAVAAQRYGIVLRDRTHSTNVFYTEEPAAGAPNPLPGVLNGQMADKAMKAFPWDKLQVLDAPTCSDYRGCTVTQHATIDLDGTAAAGCAVTLDTSSSRLEHPRSRVEWDLDGDGSYETQAGRGVKVTFTPTWTGTRAVGVRITSTDGQVAVASRDLTLDATAGAPMAPVSPPAPALPAGPPAPSVPVAKPAVAKPAAPKPAAPKPAATPVPAAARAPRSPATRAPVKAPVSVGPAPAAPAPARVADVSAGTPAVAGSRPLRYDARRRRVQVSLRCPKGGRDCTGRAAIVLVKAVRGRGGKLAAGACVGTATFRVRAGTSKVVQARVSKRIGKLLRRAKVTALTLEGTGKVQRKSRAVRVTVSAAR